MIVLESEKSLSIKFASELQTLCKMKNISLNELSTMIGMERKYLSQCLMANRMPPDALLLRIGTVFKFKIDKYMSGRDAFGTSELVEYYESLGLAYENEEWYEDYSGKTYEKTINVDVPYDSLKLTDNKMRGCYLIKNCEVLFATDGVFNEDGGIYCCLINNKKYIRLVYDISEDIYGVSTAGGFSHEAPRFCRKNDIMIIGHVLAHYFLYDADGSKEIKSKNVKSKK